MNTYDIDARIGYGYIFTVDDIELLSSETQQNMRSHKDYYYEMADGNVFFGILADATYDYEIIPQDNFTNLPIDKQRDLEECFNKLFKERIELNFYLMRFKFTDY